MSSKKAGDIYNEIKQRSKMFIPRIAQYSLEDNPEIDDSELELMGYFIADGSVTSNTGFRISVSRDYKVDQLDSMQLHISRNPKGNSGVINFQYSDMDKNTFLL
ncbi:MAG: hypothetical protein HC798_02685 [Polaribacter sp.]|nr:hypothetical protein [Polaribacter sp.]